MSETTSPVLQSTLKMHAHRCEACAAKGKDVVWIHPDADFAQLSAHKCPECGTVNWKQSKLDNERLPQPQPRNATGVKLETVLGYVLLFVALGVIAYGAYIYWQRVKDGKAEIPDIS